MPTLNYTTIVPVSKTVSEVQGLLAKAEADEVSVRYVKGVATGVGFKLTTPYGQRSFLIRVDTAQVHKLLLSQRNEPGMKAAYTTPEHAARVAWRVTKDWLEALVARVEAHMSTISQEMLPYLLMAPDETVYDRYLASERAGLALEAS